MSKATNKYLVLFLILIFAFTYRMSLMHLQTYPPGADIGLHESVIQSITKPGNTDFLWNYYQMGGGESLTFPGYHIFLSYVISMTGLTPEYEYLAHSLVASLFSSLIALCAFLVTRTVWKESAAIVVAFLVAISRFDIEMLLWGGYPNAITLMLIPLTYYMLLQKSKFSLGSFLVTTSLLSGTMFLTHSLSSAMFVSITFATVILGTIFAKKIGAPRKHLLLWLAPIFIGILIVSPFLLKIVPVYLSGSMAANQLALLSTRVLPLELVLPLLVLFPLFFLFSKKHNSKFFTVPAFLLALWILIPTVLTQGFLVGLYIDYNRFLYFVVFPVIILIAIAINHGSGFFSRVIDTYRSLTKANSPPKKGGSRLVSRLMSHMTRKNLYSLFIVGFLLFSFFAVPIFLTPWQGETISNFYQTMTESRYEAVQWVRQQTPVGAVLVSDAYFGWWLSGFAQRPTFSAVDPQYLMLDREFEPAEIARRLLDTDYLIDNGLIQVREDGGYIGRHNPMFLAKRNWTYFPYPFFHFSHNGTIILTRINGATESFDLTQLAVKEMLSQNTTEYACILVKKGNDFFNYTQCITVYRGMKFVNMSITVESTEDVYVDWVSLSLQTKGELIDRGNTVGFLDEDAKVLGQLIFAEKQPRVTDDEEFLYDLEGKTMGTIQIWASAFSVTDNLDVYRYEETKSSYVDDILAENLGSYLNEEETTANSDLDVFDYQKAIAANGLSYIVYRYCDFDVLPKFANDPAFSLEFINDEVAVFLVKRNFN